MGFLILKFVLYFVDSAQFEGLFVAVAATAMTIYRLRRSLLFTTNRRSARVTATYALIGHATIII